MVIQRDTHLRFYECCAVVGITLWIQIRYIVTMPSVLRGLVSYELLNPPPLTRSGPAHAGTIGVIDAANNAVVIRRCAHTQVAY